MSKQDEVMNDAIIKAQTAMLKASELTLKSVRVTLDRYQKAMTEARDVASSDPCIDPSLDKIIHILDNALKGGEE